jgi:hypothetical protein
MSYNITSKSVCVPVALLEEFRAAVAKFQARTAQKGLSVTLVEGKRRFVQDGRAPLFWGVKTPNGVRFQVAEFELGVELPGNSEWKVLGAFDSTSGVLIVHGNIPVELRPLAEACQHCNSNRRRTLTFALQSTSSEKIVVVGSTCLKDFIGKLGDTILANYDAFCSLSRTLGGFDGEEYLAGGFSQAQIGSSIEQLLAIACDQIETYGYVKSQELNSTAEQCRKALQAPYNPADGFNAAAADYVQQCWNRHSETVARIVEWAKNLNPQTNFEFNLKALASDGFVSFKNFGYAVYMPVAYSRAVKASQTDGNVKNEHVAPEGSKVALWATVEALRGSSMGSLGVTLKDDEGRTLIWWATDPTKVEVIGAGKPKAGDRVYVLATVKKCDTYRGTMQTVISRCILRSDVPPAKISKRKSIAA